jgi:hypothetical protein
MSGDFQPKTIRYVTEHCHSWDFDRKWRQVNRLASRILFPVSNLAKIRKGKRNFLLVCVFQNTITQAIFRHRTNWFSGDKESGLSFPTYNNAGESRCPLYKALLSSIQSNNHSVRRVNWKND